MSPFPRVRAFAIRRPWAVIVLGFAVVIAAAGGFLRLEWRTDGALLVPPDDPAIIEDRAIRDAFDVEDQVAVVLEAMPRIGDDGDSTTVFDPRILGHVVDLTRAISALDGVDPAEVTSLATEKIRPAGGGNALDFTSALDPLPTTPEALDRARDELLGMGIYRGTLLSTDEPTSATAILVGVDPAVDRTALHRRLVELGDRIDDPGARIHVVGAPIAEAILGHHLVADLWTLVPITILIMALVFAWRYRSLVAVLLPLLEVGACLIFVFGLLGYAGVPISLPITVLPVILVAAGVLDEVHVFDRYVRLLPADPDETTRRAALARALDEMAPPVVKTSVTTAVGFLSFVVSPIAPVRHFGLFAAVGVLFCMAWTLTVIAACLALDRSMRGPRTPPASERRLVALGGWVARHRRGVLAASALTVAMLPFGIARVEVRDSWIDGFAATSEFRRSTEAVNRLFHGTHLLFVEIDASGLAIEGPLEPIPGTPDHLALVVEAEGAGPGVEPAALVGERVPIVVAPAGLAARAREGVPKPNLVAEVVAAERLDDGRLRIEAALVLDAGRRRFLASRSDWTFRATGERLLDPGWLDRVERVADRVEAVIGDGGGVLSPADQVAVARFLLRGRHEAERHVGATVLENHLLVAVLRAVRGEARTREIVDAEHRRALLTLFLAEPDFVTVERLLDRLDAAADAELAPVGGRLGVAGDVAVSQTMIDAIVTTQLRSLGLSLLGVLAVAALLARSLGVGLLCLLPSALAVAVDFAAMGWLGIPLGVATSMFAAMTIGLGVDFAIHFVERCRASTASDPAARVEEALSVAGPPVLTNALVLALGFGVLVASNVPANARLGLFVVASVALCCVATLVLLPALWGTRDRHS